MVRSIAEESCEEARIAQLRSYSRLDESLAQMQVPESAGELAELLIEAKAGARKVTFRAGGHSMHDQSLGRDLVICLQRLNTIKVDAQRRQVTVGSGAAWLEVVRRCHTHGLIPYVVPTGERITCGGSLAAGGISRYTPSFGGESRFVAGFDFLEVGETQPRWIERPAPSDTTSDSSQLFRAVIGGFGFLGVVTSITYDLLNIGPVGKPEHREAPLQVSTKLWAYESWAKLVEEQLQILADDFEKDLEEESRPLEPDPDKHPAIYAVAVPSRGGGKGAVFRSVYSRGKPGKPYVTYRRGCDWMWRVFVVLLSLPRLKWLVNLAVWLSLKSDAKNKEPFVNDFEDYMFFMEGQVRGRRWYENWITPPSLPVIEQTFVCHYEKAAEFLEEARRVLRKHRIEPTLLEFLFIPKDRLLLSANYQTPSMAITLAFQDIRHTGRKGRTIEALVELSSTLHERYQGCIRLAKNVYADPDIIRRMYGPRADAFLELKQRYDPGHLIRNDFFDRIFPQAPDHGATAVE